VLARDGFVRRLTFLNVTTEALDHLAELGRDESLGARALKRGIERALTGPIAQQLASSQPGDPMLLDVALEQAKLSTRVQLLRYASARPVPLPVDEGLAGYQRVRDEVLALQESLVAALDGRPPADVAFALRALQVRLDPLRDVLERRCWDLAERRTVPTGRPAVSAARTREWRQYGRRTNDMLEATRDIHEFFQRLQDESAPLRGVDSELVCWQLELDLLQRRAHSLEQHGVDRVRIEIAPLQAGDGAPVVAIAWSDYATLLSQLDAHELSSPARGVRCFEGAGLAEAFAGECGVHLWYRGDERPVPLAVIVRPLDDGGQGLVPPTEIVRVRYEPGRDGEQRRMTDLRSGRVRKFAEPLGEEDWRLLLWDAAAPPHASQER